jgi:hypothetical protein
MAGLQPGWVEHAMDDEWAEENLPFHVEEYWRIRTWWDKSGMLDKAWGSLSESIGVYYPDFLDADERLEYSNKVY